MIIDLVRHGQSEGNVKKIIQGQYDLPLTEEGRLQATELGKSIRYSYNAIYSSPLSRALETAHIIKIEANLLPEIVTLNELMEMNFGVLQGQLFKEDDAAIKETFHRGRSDPTFRFEGGESGIEFVKRIKQGITSIVENASSEDNVLVVTHGGVIQVFNKIFVNIDEKVVGNTTISRFEYTGGRFTKIP